MYPIDKLASKGDAEPDNDGTDSKEAVRPDEKEPTTPSLNDEESSSRQSVKSSGSESKRSIGLLPGEMLSSFSGTSGTADTESLSAVTSIIFTSSVFDFLRTLPFPRAPPFGRGMAVTANRAWIEGGTASGEYTSRGRWDRCRLCWCLVQYALGSRFGFVGICTGKAATLCFVVTGFMVDVVVVVAVPRRGGQAVHAGPATNLGSLPPLSDLAMMALRGGRLVTGFAATFGRCILSSYFGSDTMRESEGVSFEVKTG